MTKLGERYELIRRLGAGGMAEVWLAHDEELAGRPVAIKIMHQHMLPNADDVERFQREMRFAAMMDHPNIVTLYTTGSYHGAPFLVMEYLRGHDLERQLPGWDAEHIAGIGRDICSGLAYAHREGVIHRDVKPGNLFLCESGQVKITDFGVARAVGETALSSAVLVGTFAYMPPERWRGDPSAYSSDIWAAGCVLYRLISGRLPRQLPDVADYSAAATRGEPVLDLRDITDVPGWLADPVMAMLADDPARRPTAGDCAKALSRAQLSTPFPVLSVGAWRLPGQSGELGGFDAFGGFDEFGLDEPVTGLADVAPSQDPVTTPVVRPTAAPVAVPVPEAVPAAAGRPGRVNRVMAAIGGVALLLFAGSITAWRLDTSPQVSGHAAGASRSSGANHAAVGAPVISSSASRSPAVAPPGPASTAGPAASSPGSAAGSPSASPTGSPSASPTDSASPSPSSSPSSATTPPSSPPASSTPPLVPVPNVIGMNFPQALRLLQSDGFAVDGTHTPPGNVVVSESPSGEAPAGSTIVVVYGGRG